MYFELSTNLAALRDPNIHAPRFQLLGYPLYSDAFLLRFKGVTSVTAKPPMGAIIQSWRNGKLYYTLGGEEYEFLLADQFASVQRFGGWVRYDEYGLRVRQGRIVEFHISCSPYAFAELHSRPAVVQHFGQPEQVDEWWDTGELMSSNFVYTRGIQIHFDDWDRLIVAINVGDSLMYDEQGRREVQESLFDER